MLKLLFPKVEQSERETFEKEFVLPNYYLFTEAKIEYGRMVYWFLTNALDLGNFWCREV